jgi:hypothetical protein
MFHWLLKNKNKKPHQNPNFNPKLFKAANANSRGKFYCVPKSLVMADFPSFIFQAKNKISFNVLLQRLY